MAARSLPVGTKIRVDLTVRITGEKTYNELVFTFGTLTLVREAKMVPFSWNHFLYLGSPLITEDPEGVITAEFDAVVTGPAGGERSATTKVRDADGYMHFVYLGSDGITVIEDEKAEEVKAVPADSSSSYAVGDKIRVSITGTVGPKPVPGLGATNVVAETKDGRTHYLYLRSPLITGDKNPGGTVRAEFTAIIGATPYSGQSTLVSEILEDGSSGFRHYVYLDSSAVTRLPAGEETAEEEEAEEAMTPVRDTITSEAAASRIAELESRKEYAVVRVRNGAVLKNCADEASAAQFITDEDYDPARVVVRRQGLDAAGARELELLRRLSADLAGLEDGWTVYRAGYFSDGWARGEAVAVLGIDAGMLTAWPLNLVDWDDAAAERRDDCYNRAGRYGGTDFYISAGAIDG